MPAPALLALAPTAGKGAGIFRGAKKLISNLGKRGGRDGILGVQFSDATPWKRYEKWVMQQAPPPFRQSAQSARDQWGTTNQSAPARNSRASEIIAEAGIENLVFGTRPKGQAQGTGRPTASSRSRTTSSSRSSSSVSKPKGEGNISQIEKLSLNSQGISSSMLQKNLRNLGIDDIGDIFNEERGKVSAQQLLIGGGILAAAIAFFTRKK